MNNQIVYTQDQHPSAPEQHHMDDVLPEARVVEATHHIGTVQQRDILYQAPIEQRQADQTHVMLVPQGAHIVPGAVQVPYENLDDHTTRGTSLQHEVAICRACRGDFVRPPGVAKGTAEFYRCQNCRSPGTNWQSYCTLC